MFPGSTGFDPRSWISRLSSMSEEYIVFQLGDRRTDWLERHAGWIAGLVRLETEPLSEDEVREATKLALSYTPTDLVVLDWAAGFVADTRMCRHASGHRIRQRAITRVPPHRRPARRPA